MWKMTIVYFGDTPNKEWTTASETEAALTVLREAPKMEVLRVEVENLTTGESLFAA